MKTIWKFPLKIDDVQEIEMPQASTIIHVDKQLVETPTARYEQLCLWATVFSDARLVKRRFHVVGTGNPVYEKAPMAHLGSVVMGPFVWHVFEENP